MPAPLRFSEEGLCYLGWLSAIYCETREVILR
jgi:hypothetical protein